MGKYQFENHVSIPSETARLKWAAERREALKAKVEAAPKREPVACASCDDTVLASARPGVHCHWSQSENALICLTTWAEVEE